MSIGDKIKAFRTERGLSQDRLAKMADVALNTLVKIETQVQENPTIQTVRKIASALEVTVSDLIDD